MYSYDENTTKIFTEAQLVEGGFPFDAKGRAAIGIHPLTINSIEYDKATEGVEADGFPVPHSDESGALYFVQEMRKYNIVDRAKVSMLKDLAEKRWNHEVSYVRYGNAMIATSREARIVFGQHIEMLAWQDMGSTVSFKAINGWCDFTVQDMDAIQDLVFRHVQMCFDRERELTAVISAATTLDDLNAIDLNEGWPRYPDPRELESVEI